MAAQLAAFFLSQKSPFRRLNERNERKSGFKKSDFCGLASSRTDGQRTNGPGTPPPPRRKFSARGRTLAPPHSNKLSAVPGAEKMEYFITFPASALVWKALLGASSGHFRAHFPPRGPSLWPPARGVPPFGPVFGLNCKQGSHKLESPLGRACVSVWRNKVVVGKLCASATRSFFSGPKVAVLAPEQAK